MTFETTLYDASDYLDSPEMIVAYLDAAFEDGDPATINGAIGAVARAKGMTSIAKETGFARESLYRALSADGHPEFATIVKVLQALGVRLTATPIYDGPGAA